MAPGGRRTPSAPVWLIRSDRSAAGLQRSAPYDGRVATTELRTAAVTPRGGAAGGRASRGVPSLRQRQVSAPAPGRAGWVGPVGVALVAGVLRFYRLGSPHAFVFDETYYAKDAWSLLRHGVEVDYVKNANQLILDGKENVFSGSPAFVVHPPAGKWIISVGEQLFGLDPFRSEEHTSELQSLRHLVCRLLLEKKHTHSYRTT